MAKSPDSKPRIAVSVSKKVAKSAVIRNRTRRRVYAALRGRDMRPGLYLFIAKAGAQELKGEALSREIGELLNKVF